MVECDSCQHSFDNNNELLQDLSESTSHKNCASLSWVEEEKKNGFFLFDFSFWRA